MGTLHSPLFSHRPSKVTLVLKVAAVTVVGVTGGVWFNSTFRQALEQNVPGARDTIQLVLDCLPIPPKSRASPAIGEVKLQLPFFSQK